MTDLVLPSTGSAASYFETLCTWGPGGRPVHPWRRALAVPVSLEALHGEVLQWWTGEAEAWNATIPQAGTGRPRSSRT
jgi:hypothetical protein